MKTQISLIEQSFSKTYQKCVKLCQKMGSAETLAMSHGEVERCIQTEGVEWLRQLFQDHLDLRTVQEEKAEEAVGQDGIKRIAGRSHERQLESIFALASSIAFSRSSLRLSSSGKLTPSGTSAQSTCSANVNNSCTSALRLRSV